MLNGKKKSVSVGIDYYFTIPQIPISVNMVTEAKFTKHHIIWAVYAVCGPTESVPIQNAHTHSHTQ